MPRQAAGASENHNGPASIIIQRKVEWSDTDASGRYQHASIFRWTEAAEAALHSRLGIAAETFGTSPRVHVEASYMAQLWFLDVVDIELRVDRIGEKSLRYLFEVRKGGTVAASGEVTVAHMARGAKSASPWPAHVRKMLGESGEQREP